MRNHTVVVGYGTKGRTAVAAMIGDGVAPAGHRRRRHRPVPGSTGPAPSGLVTVRGDANRSDALRLAGAQHAKAYRGGHQQRPHLGAGDVDRPGIGARRRRSSPRCGRGRTGTCCCQSGADSVVVSSETAAAACVLKDTSDTPTWWWR